ncbi:MAG: redoxin domain-containing protein [Planctomycetes bacterium]|nr:redoxin domain-containing protein [Planctomycetota bacterium]
MTRSLNRRLAGTILATAAVCALAASAPMLGPEHAEHADPPKIGEKAPNFTLTDLDGKKHDLKAYLEDGKTVVLEWFNPGCPWVVRAHENDTMKETFDRFKKEDVVWLAINSGAPGKQGHGEEVNTDAKEKWDIEYPILLDEDGKVGKAYGAKTTPHMYVISSEGVLVYKGAIDNRKKDSGEENYVKQALEHHLAGETIETPKTKAYGCAVKYAN